jgi:NADPH:quinone reductase-like Zn-dependent oxidoreductase
MRDRLGDRPTMRAAVIRRLGPPEVVRTAEVPIPEIGEDEVVVRIGAAGVNAIDWLTRAGAGVNLGEPPVILGWDLSGTVARTGMAVHEISGGDEVFTMARFPDIAGAYAEYAAVPGGPTRAQAERCRSPDRRMRPHGGLTAWQTLFDHAHLNAGQRVLIHSAAGPTRLRPWTSLGRMYD